MRTLMIRQRPSQLALFRARTPKRHFINLTRSREAEHETIVYCKAHPDKTVIQAIGVVIEERKAKHLEMTKGRVTAAGPIERFAAILSQAVGPDTPNEGGSVGSGWECSDA
jgi:hypothetical protein